MKDNSMPETNIFSPIKRTEAEKSQALLVPEDKQLPGEFNVPRLNVFVAN